MVYFQEMTRCCQRAADARKIKAGEEKVVGGRAVGSRLKPELRPQLDDSGLFGQGQSTAISRAGRIGDRTLKRMEIEKVEHFKTDL